MPAPPVARKSRTPEPALLSWEIAPRSCTPQSQRSEPSRSPVKHSEWRRISTGSVGSISPTTMARRSLPPSLRALERHVPLRHRLQGARRRLLVGADVVGIDVDEILLARPVAPLVASVAGQ